MKIKHFFILTFLLLLSSFFASAQTPLVKNGKAKGRIICSPQNTVNDEAASLLRQFVERISGASMPIVHQANPRKGKTVISTRTEHKCTLETLSELEKQGYKVIYLNVGKDGKPDLEELQASLDDSVALMCFTHVNNESGSILPLDEIVKIRKEKAPDTALYLDCVQSLGKLPLNLKAMGVDMASFSGHKIEPDACFFNGCCHEGG